MHQVELWYASFQDCGKSQGNLHWWFEVAGLVLTYAPSTRRIRLRKIIKGYKSLVALDNTVLKVVASLVSVQTPKLIFVPSFKLTKGAWIASYPYVPTHNHCFEYTLPNVWIYFSSLRSSILLSRSQWISSKPLFY